MTSLPAADVVDLDQADFRLLRYLAVEGITGQEREIAHTVERDLLELGLPRAAVTFDRAHEKIALPTQTGNLIVKLPGTRPGPRRLFMTHLDTVPLCAGARPVRSRNRILPDGKTALGGDNRTGVATLVTMLHTLTQHQLPHGPLTCLFTVREESGLHGARHVDLADLGHPTLGFNVDGGKAQQITIGAVGATRWQADLHGRAAHAGVHPERGISATVAASLALARVYRDGWFGKIQRDGKAGTSNVGSIGDEQGRSAGQATNVVTDFARVRGEARSHDMRFVRAITQAYRQAFRDAAREMKDDKNRSAKLRFDAHVDYYPFHLRPTSPVVRVAKAVGEQLGWTPELRLSNGGLDANWLVRHGVPTITFGAGQNNVHTVDEFVSLNDFHEGCRYAVALAASNL